MLDAIVMATSKCITLALIVQPLDQLLKISNVFLAELFSFAEVRHQGPNTTTTEQPIEQPGTFIGQPLFAPDHRTVQIAPTLSLSADRAVLQQASEQRLDGGRVRFIACQAQLFDGPEMPEQLSPIQRVAAGRYRCEYLTGIPASA
jgi:hypothetical protein